MSFAPQEDHGKTRRKDGKSKRNEQRRKSNLNSSGKW